MRAQLLTRMREATNMTDEVAALALLADADVGPERETALEEFYAKWEKVCSSSSFLLLVTVKSRPSMAVLDRPLIPIWE